MYLSVLAFWTLAEWAGASFINRRRRRRRQTGLWGIVSVVATMAVMRCGPRVSLRALGLLGRGLPGAGADAAGNHADGDPARSPAFGAPGSITLSAMPCWARSPKSCSFADFCSACWCRSPAGACRSHRLQRCEFWSGARRQSRAVRSPGGRRRGQWDQRRDCRTSGAACGFMQSRCLDAAPLNLVAGTCIDRLPGTVGCHPSLDRNDPMAAH